jgi:hypothetical protein
MGKSMDIATKLVVMPCNLAEFYRRFSWSSQVRDIKPHNSENWITCNVSPLEEDDKTRQSGRQQPSYRYCANLSSCLFTANTVNKLLFA